VEEGGVRLTYLGHSAVLIETSAHMLLVDPFLSGNPLAAASADGLAPDYILLTDAHSDRVTMDPGDAARAAELLCARRVVPIHHDTFEVIRQDPREFRHAAEAAGAGECLIMEPGRTVEL
jgi:L-ascorbate metabolism protein UlaG (beta-lactamase superfamily)